MVPDADPCSASLQRPLNNQWLIFKEEKKTPFVYFLPVSDFRMLTLTERDYLDSGVAKDLSTKATVVTVLFM